MSIELDGRDMPTEETFDDLKELNCELNKQNNNLITVLKTTCLHGYYLKSIISIGQEETDYIKSLLYSLGKISDYAIPLPVNLIETWPRVVTTRLGDVIFYSTDGNINNISLKLCLNDKLCIGLTENRISKNYGYAPTLNSYSPSVEHITDLNNIIKKARPQI